VEAPALASTVQSPEAASHMSASGRPLVGLGGGGGASIGIDSAKSGGGIPYVGIGTPACWSSH
jgi:hypothetical protein